MSNPVPIDCAGLLCGAQDGHASTASYALRDSPFDLQIEHIISEKHGGPTTSENLAASCVFCNRFKGSDVASISPTTGKLVRLFHPRRDRWPDHFDINGPLIVPITEVAEATARLLRFNDDNRLLERKLLQAAGRYPRSTKRS